MEEEEEMEIQVRSISGDSITVSISPGKTIEDLKLLLNHHSFPPSSSDFHLFLRGAKLESQSLIRSHSIGCGEFVSLLPFSKKRKSQHQQSDTAAATMLDPNRVPLNLAESTWRDMMEDLSYLHGSTNRDDQAGSSPSKRTVCNGSDMMDADPSTSSRSGKHQKLSNGNKKQGMYVELITSILQSASQSFLDKQILQIFLKALDSINCLSDVRSGNCILVKEANLQDAEGAMLCICPAWLITTMKTFAFVNILAGFLQLQEEKVTINCLKDALNKLTELGLYLDIEDFKRLSVLCPKVIRFVNQEDVDGQLHDVIMILNFEREKEGISTSGQKRVSLSKSVSTIKKRETLFRKTLWEALRWITLDKHYQYKTVASLEELITSSGQAGSSACVNEAKQVGKRSSGTSTSRLTQRRCYAPDQLSPMEMVEHLRKGIGSQGQIVHVEEIEARIADLAEIPDELSEKSKSVLKSLGIEKLYSHQARSILTSLSGRSVIVATMTSSGKSLCYNLPVLEALSQDVLSCALYLFPTKALAQDQLRALYTIAEILGDDLNIGVYDGDTSQEDRACLRDNARLLITNPDMLHMSILPSHRQFQRIFSNLKFIVIDEAHAYKGAFGCHTALILRRLCRLCSHVYGSDPSFVLCTATSANPSEHAVELANLPTLELIEKDGSPSGPKLFVLWNPPFCLKTVPETSTTNRISKDKTVVMRRSSPIQEVSCLLAEMVQHGLRCIAFCKTRKLCELVLSYTSEILQDTAPHLVDSICAYRAGYIAEDRRRIEREFFSGKLCGIAATNALELGIDVGDIDVTLHLGFPGSVASLWQQAGRAGRRGKPSLAVYVAFEGPLDQYFMKYPQKLFRSPIECCHVDSQNKQVLEQHLLSAAIEHPLSLIYDEKFFGSGLECAIMALEKRGLLSSDPSRDSARIWSYIGHEKFPSRAINIRAIESEKYKVMDKQTNEVLEEIEESRAFFQVYEGAVYMNQGKNYLVKELDLSNKVAICLKADLKYYTKTRDYTDIHVIGGDFAYPFRASKLHCSRATAQANTCKVTTTWFGFRRIWRGSNTVFDTVDLVLPKYSYESQAAWVQVPQSVKIAVEKENLLFRAGLHAASHAVHNVVPLYIICNSSDLAPECVNPYDTRYVPERILLYDRHPGGSGLSTQIQPLFDELLSAALELLASCCCSGDTGCPNCVQSLACQEYNEVLHKESAIMIIKGVLEAEA